VYLLISSKDEELHQLFFNLFKPVFALIEKFFIPYFQFNKNLTPA